MSPLPFLCLTAFPASLNGAVDRRGSRSHHRPVRLATPVVVIVLVAGWIFAQGTNQPLWAAIVATLCLGAACLDAVRRRASASLLVVGLVAILALLAGVMVFLLSSPLGDGGSLLIQLVLLAALAPVVPLLYALTFGGKDTDQ